MYIYVHHFSSILYCFIPSGISKTFWKNFQPVYSNNTFPLSLQSNPSLCPLHWPTFRSALLAGDKQYKSPIFCPSSRLAIYSLESCKY